MDSFVESEEEKTPATCRGFSGGEPGVLEDVAAGKGCDIGAEGGGGDPDNSDPIFWKRCVEET